MNSSTRRLVLIIAVTVLLVAATIWALAPGRVEAQCYSPDNQQIPCEGP